LMRHRGDLLIVRILSQSIPAATAAHDTLPYNADCLAHPCELIVSPSHQPSSRRSQGDHRDGQANPGRARRRNRQGRSTRRRVTGNPGRWVRLDCQHIRDVQQASPAGISWSA
jgi:hypothetical protein